MLSSDNISAERVQGAIEGFDAATGQGVIAGPGGVRHRFDVKNLAQGVVPAIWRRVEFSIGEDGRAVAVGHPPAKSRIDLGHVIQQAFRPLRVHWSTFIAGALLVNGVPTAVASWGAQSIVGSSSLPGISAYLLGTIANLVGSYLLVGIVAKASLNSFRGQPTALVEIRDSALQTALPLTGLAVVATLSTWVAALLLVIPALIVTVWWLVASVVVVAEGRGVLQSLHRSKDLSEGSRWLIFGLVVVYVAAAWGLDWALRAIATAVGGDLSLGAWTAMIAAAQIIANVATSLVFAVVTVSLYHDLRTLKEGDGSEQLAAVFA